MPGIVVKTGDIVRKNLLLLGRCVPHLVNKEAKVTVKRLIYDDHLHMHFPHEADIIVQDTKKLTKVGDIVLLKKVTQRVSINVAYAVEKVVYPLGDVVDPLSGRKCVANNFRDDMKTVNAAYGRAPDNAEPFDYDKAPDRGWQEGKKDFSHKEGYRKWHEFEPGHPLYNDPTAS